MSWLGAPTIFWAQELKDTETAKKTGSQEHPGNAPAPSSTSMDQYGPVQLQLAPAEKGQPCQGLNKHTHHGAALPGKRLYWTDLENYLFSGITEFAQTFLYRIKKNQALSLFYCISLCFLYLFCNYYTHLLFVFTFVLQLFAYQVLFLILGCRENTE